MSSRIRVVEKVRLQDSAQRHFTEDDDVVRALASDRTDQPFHEWILPRRSVRGDDFFDVEIPRFLLEHCSVDRIPIAQQIARRRVPWERFHQLLSGPFCGRMRGDVEMEHTSPIMSQDHQDEQNSKRQRRYDEEIECNRLIEMVGEEALPGWRRIGRSPWHVLGNGGLTDIDPKLQEFAVDSRCAPQGICATHLQDQLSDLMTHSGSAWPTRPAFPRPVLSECSPMPADHRLWLDNEQRIAPAAEDPGEHDPQPTVDWAKLRPSYGSLEDGHLMAEGQNFQLNMALVMKVGTERGEKATNYSNHGRRSLSLRSRNCNVFSVDEVYGMDSRIPSF